MYQDRVYPLNVYLGVMTDGGFAVLHVYQDRVCTLFTCTGERFDPKRTAKERLGHVTS